MFQHFLKSRPSSSFSGEQSRCSLCQGQPTPGDHYEDDGNAAPDKGDYGDDDDDDDDSDGDDGVSNDDDDSENGDFSDENIVVYDKR